MRVIREQNRHPDDSSSTGMLTSPCGDSLPVFPEANAGPHATLETIDGELYDRMPATVSNNRFERLPPDLYHLLMARLDLQQLRALVHTSSSVHRRYLDKRLQVLFDSIDVTVGSAAIDVYALHQVVAWRWPQPVTAIRESQELQDIVAELLQLYAKDTSSKNRYAQLIKDLTASEQLAASQEISSFYLGVVQPILELFAQSMWEKLCDATGEHKIKRNISASLSGTERVRMIRAIYRFQLLCYVAGQRRLGAYAEIQDALSSFLSLFPPWEIEELFSFCGFVLDTYNKIFDRVQPDLHPDHPRFDNQGRSSTPVGAFELSGYGRDNFLDGTALNGLPLLHTVLLKVNDHDHLVSVMQENIASLYIPLNDIEGIFNEPYRCSRRTSERDQWQAHIDSFPLRGNSDDDAVGGPPPAWTVIWGGTYSDLFGRYIPSSIRCWGYVFWDAATLESTGARQVLERQWEEAYDGDDPREYVPI